MYLNQWIFNEFRVRAVRKAIKKTKKTHKKKKSKTQWTKHDKSPKKWPKWSRKPWKNPPKHDTCSKRPKNRLQTSFFEGPCADLGPKVRFWTDFGSQLGPEMAPWSTIFDQKGAKTVTRQMRQSVLEPTWARFGAENGPRTYFSRFGTVFGWCWKDYRWILKDFQGFPTYFGHDFCQNFMVRPPDRLLQFGYGRRKICASVFFTVF